MLNRCSASAPSRTGLVLSMGSIVLRPRLPVALHHCLPFLVALAAFTNALHVVHYDTTTASNGAQPAMAAAACFICSSLLQACASHACTRRDVLPLTSEAFCAQVGPRGDVYRVLPDARQYDEVTRRGQSRQPIRQTAIKHRSLSQRHTARTSDDGMNP